MEAPVVRFAPAQMPVDARVLSVTELARRDRLVRESDRVAYVAAHVLVRRCVAELLGVNLDSVRLEQICPDCGSTAHGPPRVPDHPSIGVSLSHSSGHVAAIAAHGRVGIDVETLDGRIVDAALSDRERDWVSRQPDPPRAFRRLWVRKEALIKSGGATLGGIRRIDVLAESASGDLQPDSHSYTEWQAADAVGAWIVLPA